MHQKMVCKRDEKTININTHNWEELDKDRSSWLQTLTTGKDRLRQLADIKNARRKHT
uniref:Uncharacterized protein n=1 Tax=Arion vulgaris TaxID=1028688 RepID=A0A0B6ZNF6_9EUPU